MYLDSLFLGIKDMKKMLELVVYDRKTYRIYIIFLLPIFFIMIIIYILQINLSVSQFNNQACLLWI